MGWLCRAPIPERSVPQPGLAPCTCQWVVGVEAQPEVPQAGEQLGLHLASGRVVHSLHGVGDSLKQSSGHSSHPFPSFPGNTHLREQLQITQGYDLLRSRLAEGLQII